VVKIVRKGFMRIEFSWDFKENELAAIAGHLGKAKVDDDDVRSFLKTIVKESIDRVLVEHEAAENDPSRNTGP
jgi:hypothetical protein